MLAPSGGLHILESMQRGMLKVTGPILWFLHTQRIVRGRWEVKTAPEKGSVPSGATLPPFTWLEMLPPFFSLPATAVLGWHRALLLLCSSLIVIAQWWQQALGQVTLAQQPIEIGSNKVSSQSDSAYIVQGTRLPIVPVSFSHLDKWFRSRCRSRIRKWYKQKWKALTQPWWNLGPLQTGNFMKPHYAFPTVT